MMTTIPFAPQPRSFVRRCLPLLLAACYAPLLAAAAPVSPQVVAGQATFSQQGNVFSITNTPNTIINWQSFSVNAGDITRFIQQSGDSAVLNRIVGQDPSRILGSLQSNGHVFLINPNGILFGRDARIDVNGLTASTLNLANADFLAGRRKFAAGPAAGAVENQGAITTPAGGKVFLLAPNVSNSGIITSPQGEVVLAAGHSVQLVDSANPDLHVVVSAPASEALNLGSVVAQGGRIGIYGALVRQRGLVSADSARVGENGKIVFKASADALLEAGSVTSAVGAGKGGDISVQGRRVGLTGDARIDASGAAGGGSVQVGGSYQGRDTLVRNAEQTLMGPRAAIRADALGSGKGGQVVLWSDGATRAFGRISARGAGPGAGGLVETSGHYLDIGALAVDAGTGGTWLLDPYDVIIGKNGSTVPLSSVDSFDDAPVSEPVNIDSGMFNQAAPGTNIIVQAKHDITVNGAITRATGTTGSLTMEAGNNIAIDAPIATSGGALTLNANQLPHSSGTGRVDINAGLSTAGGRLTLSGHDIAIGSQAAAIVNTGAGDMDLRAINGLMLAGGGELYSAGNIALLADKMQLPGKIGPAGGIRPAVSINPHTSDRNIDITMTTASSDTLLLSPFQLNPIFARQLTIGGSAHNADITVSAQLGGPNTPFESPGLSLETQGTISINAPVMLRPDTASNLMFIRHGSVPGGIQTGEVGALAADNITLVADNMALGAGMTGTGKDGGRISLMPQSAATLITLGENAGDGTEQLGLDSTELSHASARMLSIGGQAGQTGNVNLSGALNMTQLTADSRFAIVAGQGDLSLSSRLATPGALLLSGRRISNNSSAPAVANAIGLQSFLQIGEVSASASLPFYTETSFLRADNLSVGGTAPINISNTGTLNLGSVTQSGSANNGAIKVANTGGMTLLGADPNSTGPVTVQTNGGAISLLTKSPLTIDGAVASNGGAILLEAGNGGVLTIGATGSVASGAGSMQLTGGAIVHQGSLSSTSGNITLTGNPVSGSGTISTVSGTISGAPTTVPPTPTLDMCLADKTLPGCTVILNDQLLACIADPSLPVCGAVLPTLSTCQADPAQLGCSVVLPSLAICTSAPATPGCEVVLPTLASCVANPAVPGCSAVLPTLTTCTADPATPGCSVVLPSLATCTATPATDGCSAVLPPLASCTAKPDTAGCSAVLPPLATCTAKPETAGCSVVLPPLATCTAKPDTAGCSAVLPTLAICIVTPATAGCSVVLPTLSQCTAAPLTPGCSVVLPSLTQCIANPAVAGCSVVLPTLAQCIANRGTAGCSVVLPTLAQCTANAALPGCGVVLPTLAQCTANAGLAGCLAVLPSLAQCTANAALAGCTVVLPSLAQCTASPALAGCSVVLPTLSSCIANPNLGGCSLVLPSLSHCVGSPASTGCSVVLPTLAQCVASPGLQGCPAVLPAVSTCVANPAAPGCAVVVPPQQSAPGSPVDEAAKLTIATLNTSNDTLLATTGGGGGTAPAADKQKNEGSKAAGVSKPQGDASDSRKKTYCN